MPDEGSPLLKTTYWTIRTLQEQKAFQRLLSICDMVEDFEHIFRPKNTLSTFA